MLKNKTSKFQYFAILFIHLSTYDRTTDNHISATSSSKSTDYHKQASKHPFVLPTCVCVVIVFETAFYSLAVKTFAYHL